MILSELPVHGLPPDPKCLHCILVPYVAAFHRRNPDKEPWQIIGELLQLTGELIASHSANVEVSIAEAQAILRDITREAESDLQNARSQTRRTS